MKDLINTMLIIAFIMLIMLYKSKVKKLIKEKDSFMKTTYIEVWSRDNVQLYEGQLNHIAEDLKYRIVLDAVNFKEDLCKQ